MILENIVLSSVNKNKDKETAIIFECDLKTLQGAEAFVNEVAVKFRSEGKTTEWIVGQVVGTTTSLSGCRFKILCPASENMKTASLSVYCGEAMELALEVYQPTAEGKLPAN